MFDCCVRGNNSKSFGTKILALSRIGFGNAFTRNMEFSHADITVISM